jgi:hypothetical protein
MSVVPGYFKAGRGYTSKVVAILGRELDRDSKLIGTVVGARTAIVAFGECVTNATNLSAHL